MHERRVLHRLAERAAELAHLIERALYQAGMQGNMIKAHGFRLATEHTFLPYQCFLVFTRKA